jgi:hypothetical protein
MVRSSPTNGSCRRISRLAARRGEGPFVEPTTAIRRQERDPRRHPSSRPVFIERAAGAAKMVAELTDRPKAARVRVP